MNYVENLLKLKNQSGQSVIHLLITLKYENFE